MSISSLLVATIEQFLDDVIVRMDTDPVKHIRLAALQRCLPLNGAELVRAWRSRAALYPNRLVEAVVEQSLDSEVLRGWAARDALVERGDDLAVRALLARIGTRSSARSWHLIACTCRTPCSNGKSI